MNYHDKPVPTGYTVYHQGMHDGTVTLSDTATAMRTSTSTHLPGATAGAAAHPGLSVSQAILGLAPQWEAHVHGHAARMEDNSGVLSHSNQRYKDAEDGVLGTVNRIYPNPPATEV